MEMIEDLRAARQKWRLCWEIWQCGRNKSTGASSGELSFPVRS